jgi:hypothetical protein
MRLKYSTTLAAKLRHRLFLPKSFRDHKARYDAKSDDLEAIARLTWSVHGVCLVCRMQAIAGEVCCDCGQGYSCGSRSFQKEAEIQHQIDLAHEALKP